MDILDNILIVTLDCDFFPYLRIIAISIYLFDIHSNLPGLKIWNPFPPQYVTIDVSVGFFFFLLIFVLIFNPSLLGFVPVFCVAWRLNTLRYGFYPLSVDLCVGSEAHLTFRQFPNIPYYFLLASVFLLCTCVQTLCRPKICKSLEPSLVFPLFAHDFLLVWYMWRVYQMSSCFIAHTSLLTFWPICPIHCLPQPGTSLTLIKSLVFHVYLQPRLLLIIIITN